MTKKALFLSLLIFLIIIPAFSQEKDIDRAVDYIEAQDTDDDVLSLFEIEKLIRATDYNVALEELHKYIEKYPDRFDNAQRLIKTIMNRRKRYSVLTEQAIKSSTENPEDHMEMLIMRSLGHEIPGTFTFYSMLFPFQIGF